MVIHNGQVMGAPDVCDTDEAGAVTGLVGVVKFYDRPVVPDSSPGATVATPGVPWTVSAPVTWLIIGVAPFLAIKFF